MQLPKTAHTSRPWRVHEVTGDFEIEDVWRLPTPGGPDDLSRLVQQFTTRTEGDEWPVVVRALFALRWKLGKVFGWDTAGSGVGERVHSLRERLPADLLEAPRGPDLRAVPGREEADGPPIFRSVYLTKDEWVAELSNTTVHSVMHFGWVPDDSGQGHHGQMAVLVKPNGRFGKAYMAAIKPFRYALVYPRGGPSSTFLLAAVERPLRFVSTSKLPLARMTFVHDLRAAPGGTEIVHRIELTGPLSGLYGWFLGRQLTRDLERAVGALAAAAAGASSG